VAHGRGVLHLDIKPKNILVDEDDRSRLIDFGLARLEHAWTHEVVEPGSVSGTVQYMAPEQARGETERIGPRSDLFALGGVLFFLLTGQPPFSGERFTEVWERAKHCTWDPGLLRTAHAPRRLQAICRRAMAAEPADRYPRAEDMAAALEAAAHPARRLVVPATMLAAALLVGLVLAGLRHRSEDGRLASSPAQFGGEPRAGRPAADVVASPLSVVVWRRHRYSRLSDAVPLHSADEIRLRADVPPGLYVSLFWISSTSQLKRLANYPARVAHSVVSYPADENQAAPLTGPPGTECALLCARRSGPIDVGDLQDVWDGSLPWPALPNASVLRLLSSEVRVEQGGRDLGDPTGRTDPEGKVRRRLEQSRRRLEERFDYYEAIAFAHID
jgi:eukaryotic-like serine/threonine-protein kinase